MRFLVLAKKNIRLGFLSKYFQFIFFEFNNTKALKDFYLI